MQPYLQCTELETLRSYFRSGGKRYAIRYRRKIGDTYRDVLMEMIPTEKYADSNQMIFLFVKDIDPS